MTGSQQSPLSSLVAHLHPFVIVRRLTSIGNSPASFPQSTMDMLLGATFLCVDPTQWVSQEVRVVLGRSVGAREILEWLWGTKAPSLVEQGKIISHVGAELEKRFENYKAMNVFPSALTKSAVPALPQTSSVPLGTFSSGSPAELVATAHTIVVTDESRPRAAKQVDLDAIDK